MDRQVQKAGKRMRKKITLTLIFAILYPVILLLLFPFALVETILDFIYCYFYKMFFDMKHNYVGNIKYLIEKLKNL